MRASAVVAAWARYAEGVDEEGVEVDIQDRLRDDLMRSAQEQYVDPLAFLRNQQIFGELVESPEFVRCYVECLQSLHEVGAYRTLEYLNETLATSK